MLSVSIFVGWLQAFPTRRHPSGDRRSHQDFEFSAESICEGPQQLALLQGERPAMQRRQILWFGVTAHPTTEWIANQLTEACGWEQIPRYLVRDRDQAYGAIFVRRVRSIGIRDRPTSFRSPWQNAYAERLIGSIRRECIDHVVVFGERHLRHVLLSYQDYYNDTRTHLSLNKDAPVPRGVEWAGNVVCRPILGGLHHQYGRM
ncbi:integrase core domain-containing protein [Bradyrhizobium sp. 142]|uniref:integrase core domain-containing protein n=1 Tax=Bradyrhizobium sp. 142 TaxID=2782618 RepID=UPI001FF7B8BC|nr:integrase core domain-containing protein [Bradyrhizobium sp. 142]MCK1725658.1 transposase [Bradyrhizobium sp. 142]